MKDSEVGVVCGTRGIERKVYSFLVWKSEGKGSLGRPKHRWQYGIRMDLTEIDCRMQS